MTLFMVIIKKENQIREWYNSGTISGLKNIKKYVENFKSFFENAKEQFENPISVEGLLSDECKELLRPEKKGKGLFIMLDYFNVLLKIVGLPELVTRINNLQKARSEIVRKEISRKELNQAKKVCEKTINVCEELIRFMDEKIRNYSNFKKRMVVWNNQKFFFYNKGIDSLNFLGEVYNKIVKELKGKINFKKCYIFHHSKFEEYPSMKHGPRTVITYKFLKDKPVILEIESSIQHFRGFDVHVYIVVPEEELNNLPTRPVTLEKRKVLYEN